MIKNRKKSIILISIAIITLIFVFLAIWGNSSLKITSYEISSSEIPESFDGYRITLVSDLHDVLHGKDNNKLTEAIKSTEPDIIVLCGDMIDCTRPNESRSLTFIENTAKIAKTYYVTGNHESQLDDAEDFLRRTEKAGAEILRNESIEIERDGKTVNLIGIDDPFFLSEYIDSNLQISVHTTLQKIMPEEGYNILLSHRPDYFDIFLINGADLVLSGHTHGGQFRLPVIGGLYAPDQGIFPRFDKGLYQSGDMNMIISSGTGNSGFPLRLNNRPEIVTVTLKTEEN